MSNKYTSDNLKALKGLEAVRKRPGMYIGSTDVNGLHHLVWEVVDNSIDEALAKFSKNIRVKLKSDGSVVVQDDGRGIPIDIHKDSGLSGVELVFTELHAGGKFGDDGAYKTAGGLHGVGASVVNALSDAVEVTVYKNGKKYFTRFERGVIVQKTTDMGPTGKKGTRVQFWPDYKIFKKARFSFDKVTERLREAAYLIEGLKIVADQEGNVDTKKHAVFYSEDGMRDFVKFVNESKTTRTRIHTIKGESKGINVSIGFQYTSDYNESLVSFVNNIKTRDGGAHVQGFKNTWTKMINDYARESGLLKTKDKNLDGDDIREGLTAIISLQIPEKLLEFVGQTKDSLRTPDARQAVEAIVSDHLRFWLGENKKEATAIVNNSLIAKKARDAARKARSDIRSLKKAKGQKLLLSGKLTPAQTKVVADRELFLVEGDSAGGSAKMGRDRKFQAILPLRGKVMNTEKAKLVDIYKNEELSTIINTIGADVAGEFDIKKVKYGKVIIMTDADTDGAHIQTLLLTFLFRYMRPLIENGHVYIAMPPLFKVTKHGQSKKHDRYAWSEEELSDLLQKNKGGSIQRFKGLGEMNADQLWDTTMDPTTRMLVKVNIDNIPVVERRVSTLMGDKVEPRKKWINDNVQFSMEDDFDTVTGGTNE